MKVFAPGHVYDLDDGTEIAFRTALGGPGTTTCELLQVLMHRIETLDKFNPCLENITTLHGLHAAHGAQLALTERIAREKGPTS